MRRLLNLNLKFILVLLSLVLPALALAESPRVTVDPDEASEQHRIIAAASNNAAVIKATPAVLKSIVVCPGTATVHFVKLYNKATAPTCGTDVPVMVISTNVVATGFCNSPDLGAHGSKFSTGLGVCIVTGVADSDNTSASASGALVTIGYK